MYNSTMLEKIHLTGVIYVLKIKTLLAYRKHRICVLYFPFLSLPKRTILIIGATQWPDTKFFLKFHT